MCAKVLGYEQRLLVLMPTLFNMYSWNSCRCCISLEDYMDVSKECEPVSMAELLNKVCFSFTSEQFTKTCNKSSACAVKGTSRYSDNQCNTNS